MEEENQVFGIDAEDINDFNSEEKFSICHKDKENAEKTLRASAKDLEDFFESFIKDEPNPTEEEVSEGIRKILERAYPEKKVNNSKKVALKVLFAVAILSALAFSCLFAIGSSHNINIENGFVTFAKDTMKIVFFNDNVEKEEYITVDALLTDLEQHGYSDILFPQDFVTKSDEYKVSKPVYYDTIGSGVSFKAVSGNDQYCFEIQHNTSDSSENNYKYVAEADTIRVGDVNVYVFSLDNEETVAQFVSENYRYGIKTQAPNSDLIEIIKTIGTGEN